MTYGPLQAKPAPSCLAAKRGCYVTKNMNYFNFLLILLLLVLTPKAILPSDTPIIHSSNVLLKFEEFINTIYAKNNLKYDRNLFKEISYTIPSQIVYALPMDSPNSKPSFSSYKIIVAGICNEFKEPIAIIYTDKFLNYGQIVKLNDEIQYIKIIKIMNKYIIIKNMVMNYETKIYANMIPKKYLKSIINMGLNTKP